MKKKCNFYGNVPPFATDNGNTGDLGLMAGHWQSSSSAHFLQWGIL